MILASVEKSVPIAVTLNLIKEKFISILTGIYHKRIAYPGQEDEEEAPSETVAKSV